MPAPATEQERSDAATRPAAGPAPEPAALLPVGGGDRLSTLAWAARAVAAPPGRGSAPLRAAAVLGLQRSAGNRAVSRRVRRAGARTLQRTFSDLFDHEANRDELFRLLHAPVLNVGAVFRLLQPLQREAYAVARMNYLYQVANGQTLAEAIAAAMTGAAREYALALVNAATPGANEAIGAPPASLADYQANARRIRAALDAGRTEEVFAALMPYRRNSGYMSVLSATYRSLFNESLEQDAGRRLQGEQLDNARYLMGQRIGEVDAVSWTVALRLFNALKTTTFESDFGTAGIPFHYPIDGCYARAHVMAELLTAAGYASEKAFVTSTYPEGLNIASDYASDSPGPAGNVHWWYHVAPVIKVLPTEGSPTAGAAAPVDMVLDPSTTDRPEPISTWAGRLTQGRTLQRPMNLGELARHVRINGGTTVYNQNEALAFMTSRDVYTPSRPLNPGNSLDAESEHARWGRHFLSAYTTREAQNEAAAVIRQQLRATTIDLQAILDAIGRITMGRNRFFSPPNGFPMLRAQLAARLPPEQMARVDALVGQ